jgi:hypothetical protein
MSPIYVYRCKHCNAMYELMLPAGPPEDLPGEAPCDSEGHESCSLHRDWMSSAPSIGYTGTSPARKSVNLQHVREPRRG